MDPQKPPPSGFLDPQGMDPGDSEEFSWAQRLRQLETSLPKWTGESKKLPKLSMNHGSLPKGVPQKENRLPKLSCQLP